MCDFKHKKPVIAVLGPTASGKTALAIGLAKTCKGHIVNCDSRQIYREMFIGTACPTPEEQKIVQHHMFAFLTPDQPFSAADYAGKAADTIKKIWDQKRIPILAGGTGFYYAALSEGLGEAGHDQEMAQSLRDEYQQAGLPFMLEKLQRLDPEAHEQIDTNNPRRVLRAIEIIISSGRPLSENKPVSLLPEAEFLPIVVSRSRKKLHQSIQDRVDTMLAQGLEAEVRGLAEKYGFSANAMKSIGYQEWQSYFAGKSSFEEVRENMIIHTRQYAKRQETWFRKRPGSKMYDLDNSNDRFEIFDRLNNFLRKISL